MPQKPLVYNATLVQRQDFTAKLAAFHVRCDRPLSGDPAFVPGQYLALGLNDESRPAPSSVRRSMSIASAPERRDALEFYIRYVEHPVSETPLTHLLWRLQEGDRLYVTSKPAGRFTLAGTLGEGRDRIRILVAAGTGLAPFLSMIRSEKLRAPSADMSRTILLHGASYPADLGYSEELMRCAVENGLRYFPTISRPHEASGWRGHTGRVEDFFLPERLEELERQAGLGAQELRPPTAGVLVCGLQGTIARCIERLALRGFVPFHRRIRRALDIGDEIRASLWWEQYDTEPVIAIDDPAVVGALQRDLAAGRRISACNDAGV